MFHCRYAVDAAVCLPVLPTFSAPPFVEGSLKVDDAGPDKAIGLRYELFEGFKVSAAVGRGNDRGFGQAGFAWEF
jgi:hypothetical protein